ncbi:MAG: AAA family ATPase, partial [Hyphomicrobium sp.]|nr:AAA family ATPase [Hyphomicrobium sp.]
MVFWRSKSEKKTDAPAAAGDDSATPDKSANGIKRSAAEAATNVVTLVTSRLADRLADVSTATDDSVTKEPKTAKDQKPAKDLTPIKPIEQTHFFGQKRAITKIRTALEASRGEHLVIMGQPGTGRLELAESIAKDVERSPSPDWIYVVDHDAPSRAKGFVLPPGDGARFRRDVRGATTKAWAAFNRYLKSEEHRISLDLLEEEMRYQSEKAVEPVRRRAEAQNIAVVKSLDGYVLAPMHEGRVVRSDVFRALPDSLKRNVEAKITAFEDELQSIVATLPEAEFGASERHDALLRQTALRAVRPGLAQIKKSYPENASIAAALDAIEETFMTLAVRSVGAERNAPTVLLDCDDGHFYDPSVRTRVVVARNASASDLLGEISRDALGVPVLLPGDLMRAGSGIVIIEAWKLAADPTTWLALSAAIRSKEIVPINATGVGIKADPIPLLATIVLITDAQSWSKLEAIEPGVARYFPHVAKLADTVPIADLSEDD